jgi:hypothetical protein
MNSGYTKYFSVVFLYPCRKTASVSSYDMCCIHRVRVQRTVQVVGWRSITGWSDGCYEMCLTQEIYFQQFLVKAFSNSWLMPLKSAFLTHQTLWQISEHLLMISMLHIYYAFWEFPSGNFHKSLWLHHQRSFCNITCLSQTFTDGQSTPTLLQLPWQHECTVNVKSLLPSAQQL